MLSLQALQAITAVALAVSASTASAAASSVGITYFYTGSCTSAGDTTTAGVLATGAVAKLAKYDTSVTTGCATRACSETASGSGFVQMCSPVDTTDMDAAHIATAITNDLAAKFAANYPTATKPYVTQQTYTGTDGACTTATTAVVALADNNCIKTGASASSKVAITDAGAVTWNSYTAAADCSGNVVTDTTTADGTACGTAQTKLSVQTPPAVSYLYPSPATGSAVAGTAVFMTTASCKPTEGLVAASDVTDFKKQCYYTYDIAAHAKTQFASTKSYVLRSTYAGCTDTRPTSAVAVLADDTCHKTAAAYAYQVKLASDKATWNEYGAAVCTGTSSTTTPDITAFGTCSTDKVITTVVNAPAPLMYVYSGTDCTTKANLKLMSLDPTMTTCSTTCAAGETGYMKQCVFPTTANYTADFVSRAPTTVKYVLKETFASAACPATEYGTSAIAVAATATCIPNAAATKGYNVNITADKSVVWGQYTDKACATAETGFPATTTAANLLCAGTAKTNYNLINYAAATTTTNTTNTSTGSSKSPAAQVTPSSLVLGASMLAAMALSWVL